LISEKKIAKNRNKSHKIAKNRLDRLRFFPKCKNRFKRINSQVSPNRNCSTLAIPWCFYKISRAFDGFSTSIIWQKYQPPELKHRPIFLLLTQTIYLEMTSTGHSLGVRLLFIKTYKDDISRIDFNRSLPRRTFVFYKNYKDDISRIDFNRSLPRRTCTILYGGKVAGLIWIRFAAKALRTTQTRSSPEFSCRKHAIF